MKKKNKNKHKNRIKMGKNVLSITPTTTKVAVEKIEIGNVGKIIVSENLKKQIDYLHNKVGKYEWSGILVYKHESGDIQSLKDLVFRATHVFLMDIGTGTLTEFHYNDKVVDMYQNIPEAMESCIGLIHSHQAMTSFHSGTDMQELEDNAGVYNYYVSLVVSFDENYKCRVAFPATSKITQESTIRNTDGSLLPFVKTVEKEVHYIADLDVEIERLVPSIATWFSDRYEEVKKEKEKPKYTGYSNVGGFMGNYSQKSFYDVDDYSGYDFNSRYNENQFTYKSKMAEKESKVEGVPVNKGKLFTNAILYGQSFAPLNILRGVAQINIAKDEDFKNHMAVLNTNLDVFHDNIYGRNDLKMDDHIKEAINHLSQYSRPKEKNNLNVIIKYLEDYAKQ